MSIRAKVLGMVDVMMRVPPILVIDEILKIDMGLPSNSGFETQTSVTNTSTSGLLGVSFGVLIDDITKETYFSEVLALTSVRFLLCCLGLFSALCIFMLWTRHLVMVYMFVISFGLTFLCHWSNISALAIMEKSPHIMEDILSMNTARLLDSGGVVFSLLRHLMAQWLMGMLFAHIHLGPRYSIVQKSLPFVFISPILLAFLPLKPKVIRYLPILADVLPLMLTKLTLWTSAFEAGKTMYNGYQYAMNFVSNFGLSALIENEWQRLNVPSVLRVFWTIRVSKEFISLMLSNEVHTGNLMPIMQTLLVDGCGTLTAVLGMTAIISVICHYIGKTFQWYLLTFDNEEEKSLGTASAVLFYMLALQTGLTSLSPDKRFVRLCRNLSLMLSALLHFIHNIVAPILMSLSAARNPSRKRHFRALTVCAFLVISPICLLVSLWSRHPPSTWLLAVTAFSVEVVVKVLVSLATYALFLLDACRQTFWEKLDDYLYYVRAFGNSVEFFFGILLFFNGAWILVFESGGAIRAIMMCIHAYFNIWCEARAGWSVFMKRRSAVHKISTLPEATTAQLQVFDDVCAICYQEMQSAKITRCRHYFHGVCLRKWLYVQDKCPLCHEIMMYTDRADEIDGNVQQQREQVPAVPARNREDRPLDNRSRPVDESGSSSSAASLLSASAGNSGNNLGSSNHSTSPTAATALASSNTQRLRYSPDLRDGELI